MLCILCAFAFLPVACGSKAPRQAQSPPRTATSPSAVGGGIVVGKGEAGRESTAVAPSPAPTGQTGGDPGMVIPTADAGADGTSTVPTTMNTPEATQPRETTSTPATQTPEPEKVLYVHTEEYVEANLRAKPTTASDILDTVPYRTSVRVLGGEVRNDEGESWYKVAYDGRTGYIYGELLVERQPKPIPPGFRGSVVEAATGKPVGGAWVYLANRIERTDSAGKFRFRVPAGGSELTVMAPGYAKFTAKAAEVARGRVALEGLDARGVYLPFYTAMIPAQRERIFQLIDDTALNAVVVDIKSDEGLVWDADVPLAREIGATYEGFDLEEFVRKAHERDIYVIGRFTVFKDTKLATNRPEWAIQSSEGGLWMDDTKNRYIDPFDERAWDYYADLAVEAANLGVDEIQWDYVRFPVDGDLSTLRVDGEYTEDGRINQITEFLAYTERRLRPAKVYISADIFGLTVWHTNENYLGQRLERVVRHIDYVSPMLYPSGFNSGSGGYKVPPAHPYGLIKQSLENTYERLDKLGLPVKVRPWLQAFYDYGWGIPYEVPQERAQRKAAEDLNTSGWLFWNPAAKYDPESFVANP